MLEFEICRRPVWIINVSLSSLVQINIIYIVDIIWSKIGKLFVLKFQITYDTKLIVFVYK